MKYGWTMLMVMALGITVVRAEEKKSEATPGHKVLGIVSVGEVDAAFVEKARTFAEFNLSLVVKVLPPLKPAGGTLEEESKALTKLVTGDVGHVVALLAGNADTETPLDVKADSGVAVVNLNALKHENQETYSRRVDRCVMRGFGFLMGLTSSPNPHSALFPYNGLKELDMIGRNFDPPFLKTYQEKAQKEHFKFVEQGAMRLVE